MKVFRCDCGNLTHFENDACVVCGASLAFLPEALDLVVVVPDQNSDQGPDQARLRVKRDTSGAGYQRCRNGTDFGACNWLVRAANEPSLCPSCRLNQIVPALSDPTARAAWISIERAKRRLIYTLLDLQLPLRSKLEDPARGLGFAFLEEQDPQKKVLTGHADGIITLNVAEADDPFREKVRQNLGETYRTLLGHFRHEVGHYYWDVFFKDDPNGRLRFREVFGDETPDYGQAVAAHYRDGPPADWQTRFVSAYASTHPWEDWAETWAHYLHARDTTETARAFGIAPPAADLSFEVLIQTFPPVTLAINALNRAMGLRDAYPFVLSEAAIAKMRFVHDAIAAHRGGA